MRSWFVSGALWLAQYGIVHCQYLVEQMHLEHLFAVELYSSFE